MNKEEITIKFKGNLIDYIDKLQQENSSLRTRIKTIKRRRKHQTQKLNKYKTVVTDLRNALEKKNNKIDKAIEYIKNKQVIDLDYLEEILKG